MRFMKKRKKEEASIDRFEDNLKRLDRRSGPEQSTERRNKSIASKFTDEVRSDDMRKEVLAIF